MEATSKPPKARDTYSHVDAEMQVKIAQYACEYGNKSAMEHFTCQLGFDVKKSSVSAWKMKYLYSCSHGHLKLSLCARVRTFCVEARGVTSFTESCKFRMTEN